MRQLPAYLHHDRGAPGARLGTVVLDLLSSTVAEMLNQTTTVEPDVRRRALLTRVHAFIEARLGDPSLSPATIAAGHHISLRYLHKLFEAEGSTVAGWIRTRRLERCRTVLLDPDSARRPVAAIATAHGFTSASHFSRVFRDQYGLPPAEFRIVYAGTPSSASATAPLNWAL